MANHIDQIIMFAVAVWMTAVGFGFISITTKNNLGQTGWWSHLIPHFRWMGPLLAIIAGVLALAE